MTLKTGNHKKKINKPKKCFFEKINNSDKPLAKLRKIKEKI